jgi:hypothetical protein
MVMPGMRLVVALGFVAACTGNGQQLAPACAPNSIVADGSAAFWIDECAGQVMSLANDARTPSAVATGQSRSARLAADATRLYWITYTTDTTADIRSMDKAGGAVTVLATNESSPDTTPGRLVVDDTSVYWVAPAGTLRSVAKTGGPATTIASTERLSTPAAGASYVYWSEGGSLVRRAKADGTLDIVVRDASNDTFTGDLLLSRGTLYYRVVYSVGEGSFGLFRVDDAPDARPAPLPIDATGVGRAPLVVFANRLYWVQHGNVASMGVDGTDLRAEAALADGEIATSLAVDGSYVYWASSWS